MFDTEDFNLSLKLFFFFFNGWWRNGIRHIRMKLDSFCLELRSTKSQILLVPIQVKQLKKITVKE